MKSKKAKVAIIVICVVLLLVIVAGIIAAAVLLSNQPVAQSTPDDVFFVSNFQENISNEELAKITKEGATIVGIQEMLTTEGWSLEANPKEVAAGIYALAVTNYNNLTQTGYMVKTDASVQAKGSSVGDVNVGIRSTYSNFQGKNGTFSQTISGVTALEGVGALGDMLRGLFGYNIQSFANDDFYAFRQGSNGGASFYGMDNPDTLKLIMGAQQDFPTRYNKNTFYIKDQETFENENAGSSSGSDIEQPEQHERPYAWSPLNGTTTGELTVAGTKYYLGSFGAGFATYNFSEASWLADDTTVTYDAENDIYKLNIVVAEQYVDDACIYAKGALIKDTQAYIKLKNAAYTECTNVIEVYGNGLIKSIQKIESLGSNERCELLSPLGSCAGGATKNEAIFAFGYTDECTDANRYAALYWPELSDASYFQEASKTYSKVTTAMALDLSSYPTFATYEPKVNKMAEFFVNIFTQSASSGANA